ncbi:unnamed protein product [Spirodela intermedia]|uniref:Transcription factor CBF/NF-Y/archaeal histone domain-containing protein n=2 Tax=Spirodela intermedia TaxID=51605 RepID=A0A7I8LIV2_SPIIN|nr:unnamed protein product [Spirodela intermedia]CAA6672735.1 unnamed protein product [Spirodela intermedia]CAA7409961.1 unnamed protein product [Spirodela intermedia]
METEEDQRAREGEEVAEAEGEAREEEQGEGEGQAGAGIDVEEEEEDEGDQGDKEEEREPEGETDGVEGEDEEAGEAGVLHLSFPPGRVKRIMKLDREINKVNSEAVFLISLSTDLFLTLLAEKAGEVTLAKKKKSVRMDHLLSAARSHPPCRDFLLDSISLPTKTLPPPEAKQAPPKIAKPLPPGTRRIDQFFRKPSSVAPE